MSEEKWREAVKTCGRILSDREAFEHGEIDYKMKISERVKTLFEALGNGEEFIPLLEKAFAGPNNLTSFYAHGPFVEWASSHEDDARDALLGLADTGSSVSDRIDDFLGVVPGDTPSGPGTRLSIASFLLMGLQPAEHPMYRTRDYQKTEGRLGWPEVAEEASIGERYAHHRGFVDWLLKELREAGLDARDMLDAQSLVWILANGDAPDIRAWRGEKNVNSALERAMAEFENDLDPETLEKHRTFFEEAKPRFDSLFGSIEAIERLTPADFFDFFNSIDARGRPGSGLFTPGLPFPRNPETRAYRRLVEDMPSLRWALKKLLHGEGGIAERVDMMLDGSEVRTYITGSLPIPSMLLCFQSPEAHAGVQQMKVKEAKLGAAGALKDLFGDEEWSVGQRFEIMEEELASLPSKHGKEWDWAKRNLFYFSDAFRRNLEDDPLADYVDRFHDERGYPNEKDKEDMEAREEFAGYISEDAMEDFNWPNFQHLFNSAKYGPAGPQAGLNTRINAAEEDYLDRLLASISHLLYSDSPLARRLDDVLDGEYRVENFGESVATKLLAVRYPESVLPVFTVGGDKGKISLMNHEALRLECPETAGKGDAAVVANDLLRERLAPYFGDDTHGMREFLYWLHRLPEDEEAEGRVKDDTLGELADDLFLEKSFLEEVAWLLREKGQVIFYGPPGTGKTFVARGLMKYLAAELSRREVVQFHPSYSYEDFVQGYRPVEREDGSLAYKLKHGPLMRLAQAASDAPGREHVLLIDEINRGNLPKILGELLYLLEYRDDEVALMYGEDGDRFTLPENLLIIGTMNTADRSIALIDAALRRRFHFVPFFPGEYPLDGLLRRWLERHKPDMLHVADVLERLNFRLRGSFGPHLQVGPSYFMRRDLSEEVLESVWKHDIMPFLEDQLFGHEEELAGYALDDLRRGESANDRTEGIPDDPSAPDE